MRYCGVVTVRVREVRLAVEPQAWLVSVGTGGVLTSLKHAAQVRDMLFPPTALPTARVVVLDLNAVPTPGYLEELILPLARGIRGGSYGPLKLVVSTPDPGVVRFLHYLATAHDLPIYVTSRPDAIAEAKPVGDLTPTELETLDTLAERGGSITASELSTIIGIEATAAGNRLVNLARKGYVYRFTRPKREGDLFVDPRSARLANPAAG